MNDYRSYFNKIEVPGSLHRKLLAGQKPEKHAAPAWVKYGGMAACLALVFLAGWGFWRMMPPPMGGDITVGDSLIPGEKDTYGPGETPGVLATPTPVLTEEPYVPTLAFTDRTNDPEPVARIILPKGHFELPIRDKSCLEVLGIESELLLDSYTIMGEFICAGDGAIWQVNIRGVSVEDAEKTFTIALAEDKLPLACIVYEDGTENKINGTSVQADYFAYDRDGDGKNEYISRTTFMNRDIGIRLEVVGRADTRMEAERLTLDILQGTGGRLSSVPPDEIPAWRSESLTLDEARAEEGFGAYIPTWVPEGFAFERAYRELGQNRDWLSASWRNGYDYIDVTVYRAELYVKADSDADPIPATEMSGDRLDRLIEYVAIDKGDISGYRGRFAVDYGDGFVVEYNIKGATPEEAVKMLDISEITTAGEPFYVRLLSYDSATQTLTVDPVAVDMETNTVSNADGKAVSYVVREDIPMVYSQPPLIQGDARERYFMQSNAPVYDGKTGRRMPHLWKITLDAEGQVAKAVPVVGYLPAEDWDWSNEGEPVK